MTNTPVAVWALVLTFRGTVGGIAVTTQNLQLPNAAPSSRGFDRYWAKVDPTGQLARQVQQAIRRAISTGLDEALPARPVRGTRNGFIHARPVLSGDGLVFGVWVCLAPGVEPPTPPPLAAAWVWKISAPPAFAVYGPTVGDVYGRQVVSGIPQDINALVPSMRDVDQTQVAALLMDKSRPNRSRGVVEVAVDIDDERHDLRAVTEIVDVDGGRFWYGLTWRAGVQGPAQESPERAALAVLASDLQHPIWVATAHYRGLSDLQLTDTFGTRPNEIVVDPVTLRATVADSDRGVTKAIVEKLDDPCTTETVDATVHLLTASGFRPYRVRVQPLLRTEATAAAVVILTPG